MWQRRNRCADRTCSALPALMLTASRAGCGESFAVMNANTAEVASVQSRLGDGRTEICTRDQNMPWQQGVYDHLRPGDSGVLPGQGPRIHPQKASATVRINQVLVQAGPGA